MRGLLTKLPSEALSVAKAYGSSANFSPKVRIADVHLDVRVVILDIRNLCDQQCTVRSAAGISFNARASC
ncbi:MAG: hypothetical protein DMG39_00875 [Acidobacteria bacterium]|nr:MAG: hypothetical protein DMG39_00875 [Acidobacteriota bacterium]